MTSQIHAMLVRTQPPVARRTGTRDALAPRWVRP
jgi:hypothetical protein